jgi:hypothetical protein
VIARCFAAEGYRVQVVVEKLLMQVPRDDESVMLGVFDIFLESI